MPKINVFSLRDSGQKLEKDIIFEFKTDKSPEILSSLVFESVNVENQNRRQGTHSTKTKAEVSGTGKKPYKQKHTGRARQGSRRNPHFRGGGVVFGPNPNKNYKIKINKKKYRLALLSTWNNVINSGKISILDDSFFSEEKVLGTKNFFNFLKKNNLTNNKILLIADYSNKSLYCSARNIPNIIFRTVESYSIRDLLNQNYLLIQDISANTIFEKFKSWT